MRLLLLLSFSINILSAFAQTKPALTPSEMDTWSRIEGVEMSGDGSVISYQVKPGFGDETLKVVGHSGDELLTYARGESSRVSWDGKYVIFKIAPPLEIVRSLKRKKTKDEEMPQDSLGIYVLETADLQKIAPIKDFKVV